MWQLIKKTNLTGIFHRLYWIVCWGLFLNQDKIVLLVCSVTTVYCATYTTQSITSLNLKIHYRYHELDLIKSHIKKVKLPQSEWGYKLLQAVTDIRITYIHENNYE